MEVDEVNSSRYRTWNNLIYIVVYDVRMYYGLSFTLLVSASVE